MKSFINIYFVLIIITIDTIPEISYSQGFGDSEFMIVNQTNDYSIMIKMFPIGAIFNGVKEYSLYAKNEIPGTSKLIYGIQDIIETNAPDYLVRGNFDDVSQGGALDCNFSVGYGLYKIEFWRQENDTGKYIHLIDTCYMDWRDAGYRVNGHYPSGFGNGDLRIDCYNDTTIGFRYNGFGTTFVNIRSVNRHIKFWEFIGTFLEDSIVIPLKGPFYSTNFNYYTMHYPIDSKDKVYSLDTAIRKHRNPGDFELNLEINNDVSTRDTLLQNPTNIIIETQNKLIVGAGKTFNLITPSNGYNALIIEDSAYLILKAYSKIIVDSPNKILLKNFGHITLAPYSELIFNAGSQFCNGGQTTGNGHLIYKKGYHYVCDQLDNFEFRDSSKMVLDDSTTLEIPDSTILHFSGIQSRLIMNPNSILKMGVGSKILFDSGASLFANGATFTSIDSTSKWDGIVLNNSDADTIINCTFNNAITVLSFINNSNSAYKNRIVTNNTFNIPGWGVNKGIYGENNYKILIKNNVFNMPVYYPSGSPVPLIYVGVYLKNNSILEAAGGDIEEDQSSNYSLNIIENTFSNGCASVILANYTSNYLPYIISDNTFNNTASVNIIGMKISGTIRDNNFTSEDVPLGIHLINSNPNLYKNTINSRDVGLHLAGHCYPNLAPYVSGEDLVWTGGNNYFNTAEIDNIQLSSSGYVNTDFGNNNFTTDNSSSYHIYGWLDSTHNIYYARDNCWNGSAQSRIYLKTYGSSDTVPVPVINTSNYSCSGEISPIGWNVAYNGNGIYDTIKLSDDNTGEQPSESDILYAQAVSDLSNGLPVQAIIDFKYLTDNYPEYEDLPKILYEFYSCYQMLDTNEGQNYRQPLYQDIVDYLNEKLLSDDFTKNSDFIDNAYEVILMAESIIDLNSAAGGYEFLAFNHPDPDIRLTASWNYNEIQELINSGEGGGQLGIENYELGIEELRELKEFQRMDKLVSEDPVMSKMKRSFEKTSNERNERIDKQLSRGSTNGEIVREKTKRSRQIDIQKEDRAKRNIFETKNMNKVEKEMRRMEDMALSTLDIRNELKINPIQNIPNEYKLEQNYPNPFNPSTTILYSIPTTQYTILKVYDVLGKEVITLVNEIKPAGRYKIDFNGSNLSSGMYFYKLEAGNFTETKRMLLIK